MKRLEQALNLLSTKGGLLRCTNLRNDEADRRPQNMSNDKCRETIPMGKTVMIVPGYPEPKVRKATAKPVELSTRTKQLTAAQAEAQDPEWGLVVSGEL